MFDALNATEHELNLLYAQNKEMLIEPREKCRIPVPIKRCPLNLSSLDDEDDDVYSTAAILSRRYAAQRAALPKPQVKPNVDFLSYIFPTERKLKAILNRSRLHLRDQIDLLWRLPFSDQEGTVSIDEVPYSNEMLKSLLIPPIQSGSFFRFVVVFWFLRFNLFVSLQKLKSTILFLEVLLVR